MKLLDLCPSPPDWQLDWEALRQGSAAINALHECPQDPEYHSEGNVGIHTEMACQALASSPKFRQLPPTERRLVFAGVLFHDIGKPGCTREDDNGRLSSRGHSVRGENEIRLLLWRAGMPFQFREEVCALVRNHQVPFFLIERADSQRLAFATSLVVRCDRLALVAWADGVGRVCAEPSAQQRIVDNIALFTEYCAENHCLVGPRAFASDHSRFLFFQKPDRDPNYAAHDDTRCEVTILSGLPASGKSHWIKNNAANLPLVSLDAIRSELGVPPGGSQGKVIAVAKERARVHLRSGTSFVWNATNLSRKLRDPLIAFFAGYNARCRIVYVEAPEPVIGQRNRARDQPVPASVFNRMLHHWTVPNLTEAQTIEYILGNSDQ